MDFFIAKCYKNYIRKASTIISLFNSIVVSRHIYGAEIWGAWTYHRNNINNVYDKVLIKLLGVPKTTSKQLVYKEVNDPGI